MIEQKIIEYAAVVMNNSVSTSYSVSINFLLRPPLAFSTLLLGGFVFFLE